MVYLDGSDLNEIGRSPTVHLGDKINAGKRKRLTKTPFKATINTYIPINTISLFPHYKVVLLSFLAPNHGKRGQVWLIICFLFFYFSPKFILFQLSKPSGSCSILFLFPSLFFWPVACHPLEATLVTSRTQWSTVNPPLRSRNTVSLRGLFKHFCLKLLVLTAANRGLIKKSSFLCTGENNTQASISVLFLKTQNRDYFDWGTE